MRRPLIFAALIAVLVGASYSGWWFLLAARTEAGFEAWVEERRADGVEVNFGTYGVTGFPSDVVLTIEQPFIRSADANGAVSWTTESIRAWAKPWTPGRIMVEPTTDHRLVLQEADRRREVEVRSTALIGRVGVGTNGLVDSADLSAEGLVALVDGEETGRFTRLVLKLGNRSELVTTEAKSVQLEVSNLILPQLRTSPLGSRLEAIALDAEVSGIIAGHTPQQAMKIWRDSSGRAVINNLRATWGQLAVAANGVASVDEALQPVIKLDAKATGLPETVDALVARGYLKSGAATAVKFALTVLGSRSASGPRGAIEVPLAVRDQTFYLGSIGLARLPRVAWY
jgi:hypothetical protein